MSSIPKKDRRPSHEFLSEFSIAQKHRLSNEKQHLRLKLDKLDVQRRRSLDLIDSERRQITASLIKQQEDSRSRYRSRAASSTSEGSDSNSENHTGHPNSPRRLEPNISDRSTSVDLGKHGRRHSIQAVSERIPRSAGCLRRQSMDVQELEQTRGSMTPEKVLSLVQRRHSETLTLTPVNFCSRSSNGKRFSFSQASETDEKPRTRTPNTTDVHTPARRMSMPVLFPNLNTCVKPKLHISRSLDSPRGTPNVLQRRHSLNVDQFRLPRRYSTKKLLDSSVAKMAGMHDVMQRTSIFQIQENEVIEEV